MTDAEIRESFMAIWRTEGGLKPAETLPLMRFTNGVVGTGVTCPECANEYHQLTNENRIACQPCPNCGWNYNKIPGWPNITKRKRKPPE